MSALADLSHKFGSQPREVKIGQSFFADDADTVFHTIRYDFVPASIDPNKTSAIEFGENGKVTITMPNVEGSGTTESVYQGQRKPHQKECVLIINNETGDIILERLNQSMIVKKARLRQEDLTGKSLALNKSGGPIPSSSSSSSVPFIHMNGNGSVNTTTASAAAAAATNSTANHSLLIPNVTVSKNNSSTSAKSLLVPLNNKNGQRSPMSGKKPKSPSMLNGNVNTNSASISRTTINGMNNSSKSSTTISPPSMPVFNTNKPIVNTNNNINNNSNNDISLDWKSKVPDLPIDVNNKVKTNRHSNTHQPQQQQSSTTNSLSDSSSSESSDSEDGESSSDHFSDNNLQSMSNGNKISNNNGNLKSSTANVSRTIPAPSMPSFMNNICPNNSSASIRSDSPEMNDQVKKNSITLSEDSDSSSDDDDDNNNNSSINNHHNNNNNKNMTNLLFKNKMNNKINKSSVENHSKSKQKLQKFPDNNVGGGGSNGDTFQSMPSISQLSQDLQLSESDSDD